eukprot:CAMPEP_0185281114 /NCGR_PEP_ID=MMETSP1359-20130426/66536_1 /TAXON_ID=552665 /ORGANISM="Bigelowiella longifila, Strain CCMP242" /LENGTH=615 /DNA_ID=CAMNT_0027876505 /DNA_START=145 /DNA_END=1992 /DNA_ORIENTATION=-
MVKTPGIPRPMHLVGATCCVTAMVFLLHNSGGFRKDTPSSLGAPVRNSIAPFAPLMPRFAKHKPTGPFRCPPAERRIDGRGLCPPPSSSLSLPASSLSAKARLAPAPGNSDSKALTTGLLSPQYPKLVLRPLGGTRKFRRPERVMLRPPGARWENKFVWSDLDPMKVARHKEDSGRRIVMCVDSSEHSIQALEWCNKKLFTKNDDVHLLHVYDFDPIAPSSSMQGPLDLQLDSAVESLGDQNRQLEISGEHKAIQMMIDYQRKCMEIGTLVVMCVGRFRRPERVMLRPPGARWENKFVWSDLDPMKVARHKEDSGRRIVMCVDSSEHSIQALEWCNKKLFTKNDDVHLLHVYDFDPIAPSSSMQGPLDLQLDSAVESLGDQNRQLEISGEHKAIQMMVSFAREAWDLLLPEVTSMRCGSHHYFFYTVGQCETEHSEIDILSSLHHVFRASLKLCCLVKPPSLYAAASAVLLSLLVSFIRGYIISAAAAADAAAADFPLPPAPSHQQIDYQRKCMEIGTLAGKPSATVMRGSCNHEICDYAVTHNADLLVVASRGLGAVRRFLLGSVSGYCVHNCKVPVLVVKEDGSSKTQNRMLNLKAAEALQRKGKSRLVEEIE